MSKNKAIMLVPNTKSGLDGLKYLASELVKHDILIKLVTKKEFDSHVQLIKGDSNA